MLYDPGYCPPTGATPYGAGAATGGAPYWTGYWGWGAPYCPGGMLTAAGAEKKKVMSIICNLEIHQFLTVISSFS